MANAKYRQTTWNGITVDYIEADISTIRIKDLGGTNLTTSSEYGINGTYFDDTTGYVHGIAVTSGGTPVRNYASTNATLNRGTLVCMRPNNGTNQVAYVSVINKIADLSIPTGWIDWAIGGVSLKLQEAVSSEAAYNNLVKDEKGNLSFGGNYRAAVGYNGSKIIMAAMTKATNCTALDARGIMKYLGCTDAIMLDGSTASQIRAKPANSSKPYVSGGPRSIYSIITVNGATWS
ncbi:phosphodiester glycosidase family protein [Paenibacillus rhizoplanae]|uniref:Phosphodiester glycosidase family protein n=1 Tax=Paenibacillus rhizoplanae TaxID=1917181 RepID=A0ABW5F3P8_9BACL